MFRLFAVGLEQRLFDVAVAVAVLLAVAALLMRIVWQPAKRLSIIQWTLVGGLVLACGIFCPWNIVSLGLLSSSSAIAEKVASSPTSIPDDALTIRLPSETQAILQSEIQKSRRRNAAITPSSDAPQSSRFDVYTPPLPVEVVPLAGTDNPRSWASWVAIIYALGVVATLCWLAVGQWAVNRLVRRCSSADPELSRLWFDLQREMSIVLPSPHRGGIRLLISNDVAFPNAVGVFRSAVLLPRWLVGSFAAEQLRPVLAHELAHVLRHDALLRWCASLFQVVFFYQPFYWWLRRELRLCQEYLADAHAAAWAKSRPEYAAQLVSLMRAAPDSSWRPSPAIGILEGRSELYRRIQMLVRNSRPLNLKIGRRWNAVAGTVVLSFAGTLGLITLGADDSQRSVETSSQPQAVESQKPSGTLNEPATTPSPVLNAHGGPMTVHIENSKGNPVSGARVKLSGFSVVKGPFVHFDDEQVLPQFTKSNAEGNATILFPVGKTEVANRFVNELVERGLEQLQLQIDHPDYPAWGSYIAFNQTQPVVLADPVTIEIRAFRNGAAEPVRDLFPEIGRQALDWSETDGVVTIRHVDLTSFQADNALRVVHLPKEGPAWFSKLIELKPASDQRIVISAELKPGVRLEGKLAAQVPRPVKKGRVFATLISPKGAPLRDSWAAEVSIAEDGNFVFESLPANAEVQLVALCDGWIISPPSTLELKDYSRRLNVKEIDESNLMSTIVFPRLCRLEEATVQTEISMQRTAACEITIVDADGNGLSGAMVAFPVNQIYYHGGTGLIGNAGDRLAGMRSELKSGLRRTAPVGNLNQFAYNATTNEHGIALVTNLPAGRESNTPEPRPHMLIAECEGYEAMNDSAIPGFPFGQQMMQAMLVPGRTEKMTIRMRKTQSDRKNGALYDDELVPSTAYFEDDPFVSVERPANIAPDEIVGRVVDPLGQPIEGAEVFVWELDSEKTLTDKNGEFRRKWAADDNDERHLLVRFKKPGYASHLIPNWELGSPARTVVLHADTYFEGIVRGPDGKPAANVWVRANQGPKYNRQAIVEHLWSETRTGSDGRYKLLVQPDTYRFEVRAPGLGAARVPKTGEKGDNLPEPELPDPGLPKMRIANREAKRVDIQLEAGVEFRAQIVDSITGLPLPNVRVWHQEFPAVVPQEARIEARSDRQGIVTIPAMLEGEFSFAVEPPAGYLLGWSPEIPERFKHLSDRYRTAGSTTLATSLEWGIPFDLKPGMAQVTLQLEQGVTVTGRVVDPDGQPVADATVSPVFNISGDSRYSVITAADGTFTSLLPHVEGFQYHLTAHDGKDRPARRWANGVGLPIETKPGKKFHNVQLRLTRPGTIRGRIVDQNGVPMTQVYVQSRDTDGLEPTHQNPATRSAADGRFELQFVRPGQHRVNGWMHIPEQLLKELKIPVVEVKAGETMDIGDLYIPPEYREEP